MSVLDLIRIKGDNPQFEERYQALLPESSGGTGGDVTVELDIPQPLQVELAEDGGSSGEEDTSLTPLWNAQTGVIYEQNERLDIIYMDLENKRSTLEDYTFDWGEIILESGLEAIWDYAIRKLLLFRQSADVVLPDWADFLLEWGIELVPKAIDYLVEKYRQARSEIGAIKTENNELMALDPSWDNYYLRLSVLKHHEEAIENLLKEINEHEQPLNDALSGYGAVLDKIENTLSGRGEPEEDDELADFWEEMEEQLVKIMPVIDENEDGEISDDEDRQLPDLPGNYPAGTLTRFLYTFLKFQAYQLQQVVAMNENLEMMTFNGQRLHLPNGDIVELTGVGTVAASPDQF
jgi:hypothetical protein